MIAALGTGQDWGTVLPSGSSVCRCKENPGWNLDLFAKRVPQERRAVAAGVGA